MREAHTYRMGIARKHRLDSVPCDLGQVGVVDASGAQVRDVAVAALVGADVWLPDIAVEGALAPERVENLACG